MQEEVENRTLTLVVSGNAGGGVLFVQRHAHLQRRRRDLLKRVGNAGGATLAVRSGDEVEAVAQAAKRGFIDHGAPFLRRCGYP